MQVNVVNADGSPYTLGGTVYLNSADGVQKYQTGLSNTGTATFSTVVEAPLVAYAINYSNNYTGFAIGSTTFSLGASDDGTTKQVNITASPTGTVQGHGLRRRRYNTAHQQLHAHHGGRRYRRH